MRKFSYIIILILLSILTSCGCGHKDGEHIPNDTLKCVVINKHEGLQYNVVTHIGEPTYEVKVYDPQAKRTINFNKKDVFKKCEVGDSIYKIIHYCPYHYYELKTIE